MPLFDLPVCELEDAILVRKQGVGQGALGGPKYSGPVTDTTLACEITDVAGQERLLFAQLGMVNPKRVRLNTNPNVSLNDRVYLQGDLTRPATVKDVRNVAERGEQYVIMVDETVEA